MNVFMQKAVSQAGAWKSKMVCGSYLNMQKRTTESFKHQGFLSGYSESQALGVRRTGLVCASALG